MLGVQEDRQWALMRGLEEINKEIETASRSGVACWFPMGTCNERIVRLAAREATLLNSRRAFAESIYHGMFMWPVVVMFHCHPLEAVMLPGCASIMAAGACGHRHLLTRALFITLPIGMRSRGPHRYATRGFQGEGALHAVRGGAEHL